MSSWLTKATVTGVSVLALGGLGAGAAFAATSTPDASPTASTATHHHVRHPGEHDEFSLHTKHGELAIDLQRGVVTATTPTSVTVRSQDGFTQTYDLTPKTKIHKQKQVSTAGQIAVGDRIGIAGTKNGTDLQARWVRDHGVPKSSTPSTTTPSTTTPSTTTPTTPPSGAPITPSGS